MKRDKGGWSSKGKRIVCKHCSNDDATLIETKIYGRTTKLIFCQVCSKEWAESEGVDDARDEQ